MTEGRESSKAPGVPGAMAFGLSASTLVGAIVVAGLVLRFLRLAAQSFWYDEAVSAKLSAAPAWDLLTGRVRDLGNPPLHNLLLHGWAQLFGPGDVALRARRRWRACWRSRWSSRSGAA